MGEARNRARAPDLRDDVLLIDCDAEIAADCPPFTDVLTTSAEHDFFFVRGISGRVNSGVLILRGGADSASSALLRDCLPIVWIRCRRKTSCPKKVRTAT